MTPPSPLLTTVTMRPDPLNPDIVVSSSAADDYASFNAGLKGEFALKQVDPVLDGSKGNVFVIGFDLGPPPASSEWAPSPGCRAGRTSCRSAPGV